MPPTHYITNDVVKPEYPLNQTDVAFVEMIYLPVLNLVGAAAIEYGDVANWYNLSSLDLKWIAFYILAVKWIHYSLSWAVRVYLDYDDRSYTGDVLGATYVKMEITSLVTHYGIFGRFIISFFLAPFLNGAYHSQQLQYYFPSLMYKLFVTPIQDATGIYLGYDVF